VLFRLKEKTRANSLNFLGVLEDAKPLESCQSSAVDGKPALAQHGQDLGRFSSTPSLSACPLFNYRPTKG
jgi:hypothetical protein